MTLETGSSTERNRSNDKLCMIFVSIPESGFRHEGFENNKLHSACFDESAAQTYVESA